jgi:hypothetical protein
MADLSEIDQAAADLANAFRRWLAFEYARMREAEALAGLGLPENRDTLARED